MKSLRVLTLTGNSVISKIKNYRKILTLKCVSFYSYFNQIIRLFLFYLF